MQNINNISDLMAENARRHAIDSSQQVYDPIVGIGCYGERCRVKTPVSELPEALVPASMLDDPEYTSVSTADEWQMLRFRHDFEYWCAVCIHIRHKLTGRIAPFVLNAPQRTVLATLESDRLSGRPIRLIMLKARQWGGSTLVQMYMAWIQMVHRRNWHSLICAHVKDSAANIRGMFTQVLDEYPEAFWPDQVRPRLLPFERSSNVRTIAGRGCRVAVASAENYNAVRGMDMAMAHLSETAFWPSTPCRRPEDLIRAVCGSIAPEPMTLVAIESTANGVGNFFHSEWLRNMEGQGDKHCIFVPWYQIEIYSQPLPDDTAQVWQLWQNLTAYEKGLWQRGLTLERILWYHVKAREYSSLDQMHAEYPTTAEEAFTNSGAGVFATAKIEELRKGCTAPVTVGDVSPEGVIVSDARGPLQVWELPEPDTDYVAAVDVGGRSGGADWSVIAVLSNTYPPRVVAQWRGHIDHDLLADRAMALGQAYNYAHLIVESNTLETEMPGADCNLSVLARLARSYPNLYRRQAVDRLTATISDRVGFHTNRRTKPMLIDTLVSYVRRGAYVERDNDACNELSTYCQLPNGAYAARLGCHDDILMTRALALYILDAEHPTSTGDRCLPSLFDTQNF